MVAGGGRGLTQIEGFWGKLIRKGSEKIRGKGFENLGFFRSEPLASGGCAPRLRLSV